MPIVIAAILSLRSLLRTRAALQLEILALRHQLQVLERSRQPRLRLTTADRLLWVSFSRIWSEWRSELVLVQPARVVGWHRRGFRLVWTWKSRHRTGRPTVPADVRELIRTMSHANPLWGAPRLPGELRKIGIAGRAEPFAQETASIDELCGHVAPWRIALAQAAAQSAARRQLREVAWAMHTTGNAFNAPATRLSASVRSERSMRGTV